MTSKTLGTWTNPPLAYVVAELAISPFYSMEAIIPMLQDALRDSYPRTIEAQELQIDPAVTQAPTLQKVWRLISADQGAGVQFGTRAISLHATSYVDSSHFLDRWSQLLETIENSKLSVFIERAGLRYIDLIVPKAAHETGDYLVGGLQGIKPLDTKPKGAIWEAGFEIDKDTTVNIRLATPSPVSMLLPPNFSPLPLRKPKVMAEAENRQLSGKSIGFIDIDCLRELKQVFNANLANETYVSMQKITSKTFLEVISSMAKAEWQ